MCGICGFIDLTRSLDSGELSRRAGLMGKSQQSRGPDADAQWVDQETGIAFDHRRLAIIDLTEEGIQPMHSSSGRYVTVFNGEIYNYAELRSELERSAGFNGWRGHSDTEVLLEAIEQWGLEKSLERFSGMFAIALWDRRERQLFLVRDRMGEKPLFYGRQGDSFYFASELKAIRQLDSFKPEINRDSLCSYLRYHYVPSPGTIYNNVSSLMPGTWIRVDYNGTVSGPFSYWSLKDCAQKGVDLSFTASSEDITDTLEDLLLKVIEREMVSDVPLGAFLSGGVDSSLIVALMQQCALAPVKTFTIGFDDKAYNEAEEAAKVAAYIGTEHTELYVTPADALDVIPKIPKIWDQPFSDASQVPTHLVSMMTRKHVTVALSGDGGDELFAGYNRHFKGCGLWDKLASVPPGIRKFTAESLQKVPASEWNAFFEIIDPVLPRKLKMRLPGQKLHKLADVMTAASARDYYLKLTSNWFDPEKLVINGWEHPGPYQSPLNQPETSCLTEWMQFMDAATYLPDDIMTKVDRAAMAVSLETRAPFLDHEIVEFSQRLPMSLKIQHGRGKKILRDILYKYVPQGLIERPKMGFGIPIDSWLRGPLRDWVEDMLDPVRMMNEGYLHPEPIRKMWADHLSGKTDAQYKIWNILVFQSWLRYWM
jgi:asparagine synthase (glutamine-hydrolysing)